MTETKITNTTVRNQRIALTTRSVVVTLLLALVGCGSSTDSAPSNVAVEPTVAADSTAAEPAKKQTPVVESVSEQPKKQFKPVTIGLNSSVNGSSGTGSTDLGVQSVQDVINQLKPIQVILGQWRGTTRKDYDNFKAVDNHEWIWDLQSNTDKPALVMSSDKSPYIRKASLTTGDTSESFVLTITPPDGNPRKLNGKFTEPVTDVAGDDNKLHRTFKLQFEQSDDEKEQWRFTFHQQENDRYLLEVDRRRGKAAFRRYDTVSTQREGTSFALSDSDYGEKTCIISQGLGTTSVSHNGKTYWVCCSGCKAAFEDNPEKWIAAAAKRDQEQ